MKQWLKMNLKISKGIVFLSIGILFLFVTFYSVSNQITVAIYDREFTFHHLFLFATGGGIDFDITDFIKANLLNYVFSILFIILGSLEITEALKDKER